MDDIGNNIQLEKHNIKIDVGPQNHKMLHALSWWGLDYCGKFESWDELDEMVSWKEKNLHRILNCTYKIARLKAKDLYTKGDVICSL